VTQWGFTCQPYANICNISLVLVAAPHFNMTAYLDLWNCVNLPRHNLT